MILRFIDILIINYNSTDYLLKCLASIYDDLDNNISATVYVFDNASNDNIDQLQKAFPDVNLLKSKKNIGFAKAVNYAISKTDAPNILLLNPDTIVDKNFLKSSMDLKKFLSTMEIGRAHV